VHSINATLELKPTAGSSYSGVIEEYHDVKGFLLAERPARVRMIGQAPVVAKNVFDMVSDGETFRIFIPSKHKFIVGPANLERTAKKPIENLRPQHLVDAIFWTEIAPNQTTLFQEFDTETGRYYILTLLRGGANTEIARNIWFDRTDLQVARLQTFSAGGKLASDVRYSDWKPAGETTQEPAAPLFYPRNIVLARPHDDYKLEIQITKLALNGELKAEQFQLEQPEGTELVQLGGNEPEGQP
jgi:outer membrane lipoprotein-sorting protein